MTPARRVDWRALAPLLGAVAAVAVLAVAAALTGSTRERALPWALQGTVLTIGLVAITLSLVGSIVQLVHAVGPRDRRPVELRVLPGVGFLAPPPPWTGWTQAAQILGPGAFAIPVLASARRLGDPLLAGLGWTMAALSAATVLLYAVQRARGGPSVLFTPDALVLREPLGTRTIPWPAVSQVQPWPHGRRVSVTVQRPDLVVRGGLRLGSPDLSVVAAHPLFLLDAVRFYAAHPGERAGIGTAEGYRRLLAALRVPATPASDLLSTSDG